MLNEIVERIRRNHALEHATLHILEAQQPNLRAGGRATWQGFYLYGDLPDEATVRAAVNEAIRRMKAGQRELAIHPRCGTNVVTAGVLSGALAMLGILASGKRAPWYVQLPNAILGAMIGALLAQPLGPWMQAKVTTSAEMNGAWVRRIRSSPTGRLIAHFVETDHEPSS
ncbi:MAG: hypothetical protein D6709_02580 [Chloroflexi bacterium]|jgi:hypothetical protein|uniref:Uncharacterized protein n=1 Tax=Candidatus Thermofonsia Clade 3 bacterium TaxID=2364212 RepID=A0A2M8QAM9_9CHLR|nr:DUF6391 domain-containing protein [Candidatus Roseilinea sp. NK_OTU-006]PJF46858.1 MAG: hypothetical protein CUN48_11675 [Candidatus Thermofonsia Clade 3 bacterium]RMG65445.1 MAG: hypothetical protein D6709_02580 [Chloroflexota bacterium]